MRFLLTLHLTLGICGAALLLIAAGRNESVSFACGAALSLANLAVLVGTWPLLLAKKLVALSIGVIVFKFAILAWILNEVATGKLIQLGWFASGLALIVVSVLVTAFRDARQSSNTNEVGS